MNKIIRRLCKNCTHYQKIPHFTDVFPNDKKKCTKFVNNIFSDPQLSPEKAVTYHTTFVCRYENQLCGPEGKHFVQKSL